MKYLEIFKIVVGYIFTPCYRPEKNAYTTWLDSLIDNFIFLLNTLIKHICKIIFFWFVYENASHFLGIDVSGYVDKIFNFFALWRL